MTTTTRVSRVRLAALAAFTTAVYAIELGVVHRLGTRVPAGRLAAAVTFDLAAVVPLAWWAFALRRAPGGVRRLLPIVVASLAGAAFVVPGEGRAIVSALRVVVLPFEIAAAYVAVRTVARVMKLARSGDDLLERLDDAMTRALGDHAVSHLLAAEAAAIAYALIGGRSGAAFTQSSARSPAFTWGLTLATVVESAVVHLMVGASHPIAAWVVTALGAYAVLWLIGQDRALAARAIALDGDRLVLRAGLRLTARVAWSLVEGADAVASPPPRAPGYLDVARPAEANVVVRFRAPIVVVAAFGVRRRVTRVGICVDDPLAFRSAIDAIVSS